MTRTKQVRPKQAPATQKAKSKGTNPVKKAAPKNISKKQTRSAVPPQSNASPKKTIKLEKEKVKRVVKEKKTESYKIYTDKRQEGVISWDDYFMSIAYLSAKRSKDPRTQVGACIVNTDKRIVGIGYNGFPRGCSDEHLPWAREHADELETKYPYVCHAEQNAILNKNSADLKGCVMYSALFPCNECTKMIIQTGIKEVVYRSDKYHDTNSCTASRRMFELAGVKYRQQDPKQHSVTVNFDI